jgi:molybdopterin-guanine dinucleotide biosynthesis protein MobB
LGLCGWSGSGKTTLLERLVAVLAGRGLKVAVVKHDAHGPDLDREGKDSDRLFRAGADVLVHGPGEGFLRRHGDGTLAGALAFLPPGYDLVLVEGHKGSSVPKVWLLSEGEETPPPGVREVVAVLGRGPDRLPRALALVESLVEGR